MPSAIDRVMQAYTVIANLAPEQVQAMRERLNGISRPEWTLTKRRSL
jgi:hypothetical protein